MLRFFGFFGFCLCFWKIDCSVADQPALYWTGADSDIGKQEFLIIQSQEALDALWKRHRANSKCPKIDESLKIHFSKLSLACYFEGMGGNNLGMEVVDVLEIDDSIKITFKRLGYQTSVENMKITQSFFIVPISTSNKRVILLELISPITGDQRTEVRYTHQPAKSK